MLVALGSEALVGLEFATGKVIWKHEVDTGANAIDGSGVNAAAAQKVHVSWVTMAAREGAVYICEDDQLLVLDAKSGEKKSAVNLGDDAKSLCAIRCFEQGRIALILSNMRVHCYTLGQGAKLAAAWQVTVGLFTDAVMSEGGKTYLASQLTTVAVESGSGKQLWRCGVPDTNHGSHCGRYGCSGDTLKLTDHLLYEFDGARLAVIDREDGKVKLVRAIEYLHEIEEEEQNGGSFAPLMLIGDTDVMVPGRMIGKLKQPWMNFSITRSTIEGMTAYLGVQGYGLYAISLTDGMPEWRLKGIWVSGAPVAQDGILYFGSQENPIAYAAAAPVSKNAASGPAIADKFNLPVGLHALKLK